MVPAGGSLVRSVFPAQQAGRRLAELYPPGIVGSGCGTWIVGALRDLRGDSFDLSFFAMAMLSSMACALLVGCRRLQAGWLFWLRPPSRSQI